MSELKIHSDKAWEIASHFSDVLASSTRTLAAMIDVALAEAAEVANQEQKPVAFIISGVLAELKKHKDASGTVWSGLNDRHPFIHEATALYASPVRTTPPPSSHVAGQGDRESAMKDGYAQALALYQPTKLLKALQRIKEEATVANDVIRLNRDGGGNGRVKVATAMHRIEKLASEALATTEGSDNG